MKTQFLKILIELGFKNIQYSSNWDDINEGYEFNPDHEPRTLIRLLYNIQGEGTAEFASYIHISYCAVTPYDSTIKFRHIISGQAILLESGDIDYEFYTKLLKNWRSI